MTASTQASWNIKAPLAELGGKRAGAVDSTQSHVNIVKFHGLICPEKIVGFVMEPLMGGDLHGTIFGNEKLEEMLVNTWMIHLARAIAFLHRKCVFHRDIKQN